MDTQPLQPRPGGGGHGVGKGGQQARAAIDQRHVERRTRIVQAIAARDVGHLQQLGGELYARRAAADDGDAQLAAGMRRLDQPGEEIGLEALRLDQRVDMAGMRLHPLDPERRGDAAHRQDERVIGDAPLGQQVAAVQDEAIDMDGARRSVDVEYRAGGIGEAVAARLCDIGDLDPGAGARSRRDAVQHRLPHMRGRQVDQRDRQTGVARKRPGQVEARHAAPYDDDPVACVMASGVLFKHRPFPVRRSKVVAPSSRSPPSAARPG